MSRKWKISLFSFLFILLIFVVTACDDKKTSGNNTGGNGGNGGETTETTEWGAWTVTKKATCTEEGVETRTSKTDPTKTETRTIEKTAHTPATAVIENESAATCTTDGSHDEIVYCSECHAVLSTTHHTDLATGHDYHSASTPATCEHAETITYTCEHCHDEYTVTGSPKLQHDLSGEVQTRETLVDGQTCKYKVETYDTCEECEKEVVLTTNYVTRHDYTAKVTKEATCTEKGVLTYTCSHGDHTYTVDIAINADAHDWGTGVVDSSTGFTTYKCSHCEAEKSTFNAANLVVAEVPAKAIQEAEEIELKNATIVLDDSVKEQFADATSVKLSAEEVDANSLEDLDQATKEKIGDNKVFDFSCEVAGNAVSQFEGSMKVTIPYTLKDGEDPNHIMVWYLDGEEVESIEAVYSNGTVTFETTHFSRYVVVKMTPQELCKLYDHIWVLTEQKDSTCVEYGQLMYVCSRCGEVKNELMPLVEHDFDIDHEHSVAATYDAEGYTEYACRNCDATKRVVIPKKPKPADNIIQNLINSLVEEDYYIDVTGMETFRDTKLAKSQIKITEDGNVYLISKALNEDGEEYISIIDLGNGYVYSVSDNEYYVSTTSTNFDMNLVKKYVYLATSYIPTDLGNEVFNKLSSILFTVEKTDNEITLTFDMDKLITLYDNLLNKTIAENIDIYVGQGTSTMIPLVVGAVLEMTVEDIMTLLEENGITLEKVAEMTKEFNNGKPLFTAEMVAPYVEQYKKMKVIDLINMVMPMVEKMMKQNGGSSVGPKQPDAISESGTVVQTGNDGQTTTDTTAGEQAQGLTTAQIVELVKAYLNKKIIEIVADAMGAPSVDAVAQMIPTKDQLTEMLDKVLELKVTLSPSYQFKKIEAKVELNATIKQMAELDANKEYKINVTLEHGTKDDVLNVDETIVTVKNSVQIFDASLNNHEWLIEALNEYLDIKGDNNLTYEFTKTQNGYLITSSEFEVEYVKEWKDKEEYVLGTMKAYYVFNIPNREYDYRYVYRTDTGFRKSFDIDGYIIYKLPDGQVEYDDMYVYGDITYNSTTKKYAIVSNNNRKVDYNDYEIITYDAFKEQYPNHNFDNPDYYLFYKSTNKVTQKVDYWYTWIKADKTDIIYLLTEAESKATVVQRNNYSYAVSYTDEALIGYQIRYEVTKTGLVYDGIEAIYSSPYSYYKNGLRASRYNYYTRQVTENVNLTTFKVVFEQPTAVNACTNKYIVKVSIDGGQTYTSYEYFVSEHKGEATTTEQQKDGCMVHVKVTCSACNEVIYEADEERHEWQETVVERAVETNSGIKVRVCKNCHEEDYMYEYWCDHYNHEYDEANEEWKCKDCGFTWSGVEYPVIFLQQVQDNNYKISYQLTEKFKYEDFERFEDFYSIGLFVYYTYTDEDDETVEGYDDLDCDYEVVRVTYKTIEKREFYHNYLVFNRAEVRELLAAWAKENNQTGIQYHICIGITGNYGGEYSYFLFLE